MQFLEQCRHDAVYALRQFRRHPALSILAVLTLSLGIGANAAVFTVVDRVLLRPLPFVAPERLAFVWSTNAARNVSRGFAPYDDLADWRGSGAAIQDLAGYQYGEFNLTGASESTRVTGVRIDAHLFPLLGVQPALGRGIAGADVAPAPRRVVILGHDLWRQRFGGDPRVLGQSLLLDAESYEIIGVMPATFRFPRHPDLPDRAQLWIPLGRPDPRMARQGRVYTAIVRVAADATIEQAEAAIAATASRLRTAYPRSHDGWSIRMVQVQEQSAAGARATLLMLLAAVGAVLMIACANVAMLLLAKAAARRREFAMRLALGARRGRIVQQLIVESALLAGASAVVGLLAGVWTIGVCRGALPPSVPGADDLALDGRIVGFTAAVAVGCVFVCGLVPAIYTLRRLDSAGPREPGRGATGSRGLRRWHNACAVIEIALATTLLAGAILFAISLLRLQASPAGFDQRSVLTFTVNLPLSAYRDPASVRAFYGAMLDRLGALPDVIAAGGINLMPPSTVNQAFGFTVAGQPDPPGQERRANFRVVTPRYFEALAVPLIAGRAFAPSDTADGLPVVAINQALARRFFDGVDPIGRSITVNYGMTAPVARQVVGIVGDVRQAGPAEEPQPELYLPYAQETFRWMTVAVRSGRDPATLASAVRTVVAALDRRVAVDEVQTLAARVTSAVDEPRFRSRLLGSFALLAFTLALLGIFGVLSYAVAQRLPELAIRSALGASRRDIGALVFRHAATVALSGAGLGVVLALAAGRVVGSMLYGVNPASPLTIGVIGVTTAACAIAAGYRPARRAMDLAPAAMLNRD